MANPRGGLPVGRNAIPTYAVLALLFLASCSPAATPTPESLSTPTATPVPLATEIHFALVGTLTEPNVWASFDATGYSYNNHAAHSAYWPRLYRLSIPDGKFEPQAASGIPSAFQQEGSLYVASVPLRSDLKWSDGSPLTAGDVAFTVNTALSFQLGFDWRAYYDPDWIDHVEATDAHTVKFYFKQPPNVEKWQYGVLQGPIVQKEYWSSRVTSAEKLLPPQELASQIASLKVTVAEAQKQVDSLITAGLTATGDEARQIQTSLLHQQGNLSEAINDLSKAQSVWDSSMQAARSSLYALTAMDEPTLGDWMPVGRVKGIWVNKVNPAYPFGTPHFARATYQLFPDEASAVAALKDGKVDSVLEPAGLSSEALVQNIPGIQLASNPDSSARFLVINPARPALADPVLRRALSCAIDRGTLSKALLAEPLDAFTLSSNAAWFTSTSKPSCGEGYDPSAGFDPARAVDILKSAGYTWAKEPSGMQAGAGLAAPGGQPVPSITLSAPAKESDVEAASAASYLEQAARYLGLSLTVQYASASDIRYAVFSSGDYDAAILGWHLSNYPAYLCDWFGEGNPFHYQNGQVTSACQALRSTTDLDAARGQVAQIQSLLAQDLPFIPLYASVTHDPYRGLSYPFNHVLGGLNGEYGAPSLAVPSP